MLAAQDPAVFEHPRATWIDPSSGREVDERNLMHEMATRRIVLLGETHTVAEIHRWAAPRRDRPPFHQAGHCRWL